MGETDQKALSQALHVKPAIPRQSTQLRNKPTPLALAVPNPLGDQPGIVSNMNRAAASLATIVCLVWALVFASIHSGAHAASRNNEAFQREWNASKVNLKASADTSPPRRTGKKSRDTTSEKSAQATETKPKPKRRGSSTPPGVVEGDNIRRSQRAVCRSQCSLERMSCDQGRTSFNNPGATGFTNRADQLRATQSSCFLAVQSCQSRC